MPGFKLGGATPDNVKMGADQASKIYMGSTMVWEYSPSGSRVACRFVAGPSYFSTDGLQNHTWNIAYGADDLICISNGLSLDFDTTVHRDDFMAAMPAAGINFRFDPDGDVGGPSDEVVPKSAWSNSGTSIIAGSSPAQSQLDLLANVFGLSPSTNFNIDMTFA